MDILSLLPHIFGACCAFYAVQLVYKLCQDFRQKTKGIGIASFLAGVFSLFLAVGMVMVVDYIFPVGSAAMPETFFIRLSFLIPLAYLAAFLASLMVGSLIGKRFSEDIISRTAYLGMTLIVMAPVASTWFSIAKTMLETAP